MDFTTPDSIPYPSADGSDKIAARPGEWIVEHMAGIAKKTQAALNARDLATLKVRGTASGLDANLIYRPVDFGVWEVNTGEVTNLPPGFPSRGVLEVLGGTGLAVVQRVTDRNTNKAWRRTCTNSTITPPTWSPWAGEGEAGVTVSKTSLAIIGDSLAASWNLAESLNTQLPGVSVYKRGWNGETTDGILLRLGAKGTMFKFPGDSLPPSTAGVAITPTMRMDMLDAGTTYTGHFSGVPGKITTNGTGGWSWARDAAGNTVALGGPVLFDPQWTQTTKGHMAGVIMGRNDVSLSSTGVDADVPAHVLANYMKLHKWLDSTEKIFFFMGTINRTTEPKGHVNYDRVVKINDYLKATYPGNFIDVRSYLVNQVIYDLGITPTAADLANMKNDCPPPSVMGDMTHYSPAAAAKISEKILKPWLIGKGYYA